MVQSHLAEILVVVGLLSLVIQSFQSFRQEILGRRRLLLGTISHGLFTIGLFAGAIACKLIGW